MTAVSNSVNSAGIVGGVPIPECLLPMQEEDEEKKNKKKKQA
jgi:hypothetical protein